MQTRSRRRVTIWNLVFHLYAVCFTVFSGFVLVPIYLKFISVGLYGSWLATGNVVVWLTIIDPGLSTVLQQRTAVAYGKGDIKELSALLTSGITLSALVSIGILLVGLVFSNFFFSYLNLNLSSDFNLLRSAFTFAIAGTSLMIFSYGVTAFNIGLQSSPATGFVFIVATISNLIVTIILLHKGFGLLALPLGTVSNGMVLSIGNFGYLFWRLRKESIHYRFSLQGTCSLAKLSGYNFMGKAAASIATNIDAFVIVRFLGAELAPMFILTRKSGDSLRMLLDRPAIAFQPAISHLVGSGETEIAREVLLRLLKLTLWLMGLIGIGLILLNEKFVSLWVGPQYFAGHIINLTLVIFLLMMVFTNGLSNLCYSLGNIKGNSIVTLFQGLLSILLVFVGAKLWGLFGIALAPILAMIMIPIWYYPMTFYRMIAMRFDEVKKIAHHAVVACLSGTLSGIAVFWIVPRTWIEFAILIFILSLLYFLVLWFFSKDFRKEVANFFHSLKFSRAILKNNQEEV